MIPQYVPQYGEEVKNEIIKLAQSDSYFSEFKENVKFEKELARLGNSKYCTTATSGTAALSLSLRAFGIGPGDEVICPTLTMIATPNAIKSVGAKPIFCDIEENSFCIDAKKARDLITSKTKAVIYVTLNGRCDLSQMMQLYRYCKYNNIKFIKDDAQSFGSRAGVEVPLQAGVFGDAHCISFSHYKLISTGQGGAVLTDSEEVDRNIKKLKNFGRIEGGSDIHDFFGLNYKFSDLLAVVGLAQLMDFEKRVEEKKLIYDMYYERLEGLEEIKILKRYSQHVPWFVDVYTNKRNELAEFLHEKKIYTRKMYPSCHSQKCYAEDGEYPIADIISRQGLWLPSSLYLPKSSIAEVSYEIREFFHEKV